MRLAGSRRGVPSLRACAIERWFKGHTFNRAREAIYGYGTRNVRMRSMIPNGVAPSAWSPTGHTTSVWGENQPYFSGLYMRARKGGGEREVFSLPFPSPFRARM